MDKIESKDFDVIIIGAGHNGLAAAATLAGKGKSVCVVEREAAIGGMSKTVTLVEGARGPQIAHLLYNLNPKVARELGIGGAIPLGMHVLDTIALAEDGRHVLIRDSKAIYADGTVHPDAAAYEALHKRLVRFAGLLGKLALKSPPAPGGGLMELDTWRELASLGGFGLGLKRLGKREMREFLRILLSNAYDLILDDLADGPLAGALAADSVRGAFAGPRSPGTVFSLMYRLGNGGGASLPIGGMGAVADAFAEAARRKGADIRTATGVARLMVADDHVQGVVLADGREINARAVMMNGGAMSGARLAGLEHFDVEAARRLRNIRAKGTAAKVNLVLSAAPHFTGLTEEQTSARLLIAPSAADVERAFNPAKYGEISSDPVIEAVIPSLRDNTLCTGNQHVLSAIVSYAPYHLEGGWDDAARGHLLALTLDRLEQFAPGLKALVVHSEVLAPPDIEALTGAPGGHWHHAEMGLDQILNIRPVNQMGRYATGLGGFYLCGASAHPGGDVMGAAGRNAAMQLMRDGEVRSWR